MTPRPPALEVSRLSKRYRLGAEAHGVPAVRRWWRSRETGTADDAAFLWALKEVSFDVAEGERIGIIGRNGAGKSTLLKVLSRVTHPTAGRAIIRGRSASLLEVGTGFNDDLSGRENVYLNAALHGLDRAEIDARYPDIVAFAELARFMDAPVKAYSSGMRMRLAFAVAAHLDPDILMLDEILAVGDMSFQRKCLARMNDLTGQGRTLLFVSHSMDAVARFCERCIWLDAGRIREDGPVEEVVTSYLRRELGIRPAIGAPRPPDTAEGGANPVTDAREELECAACRIVSVRVLDEKGATASTVAVDRPVKIEIRYEIFGQSTTVDPALHFRREDRSLAFVVAYTDAEHPSGNHRAGHYRVVATVPPNLLNVGVYSVGVALESPDPMRRHLVVENAVSFHVHEPADPTTTARGRYGRDFPGPVRPRLEWETEFSMAACATTARAGECG